MVIVDGHRWVGADTIVIVGPVDADLQAGHVPSRWGQGRAEIGPLPLAAHTVH